ncbi:MAG: hypothetical protein FJ090_00175 [Deltaproteobacteria bacterium]|nr:hypothetical protein [Deltaproteobacteria bacterium]
MMLLLVACAAKQPQAEVSADTSAPAADTGDSAEPMPQGLHGVAPSEPVPVPEFAATNRDGTARTSVDLVGHPTVIWFYPLANTAG